MKAIKFIQIKNFFSSLFSTEDSDMNYFIKYNSLLAVSEKIKEGYQLSEDQEKELRGVLKANYRAISNLEKLFQIDFPEQYIYQLIFENFKELVLEQKQLDNKNYPKLLNDWLLKQTPKQIAAEFIKQWICDFEVNLIKLKNKDANYQINLEDEKLNQLDLFKGLITYLPEESKKNLVSFLLNIQNNSQYRKAQIKKHIDSIKNIETKDIKTSNMSQIIYKLKEQEEHNVLESLNTIQQQYHTITIEIKDIDVIKKESILKLYNHYLLNSLEKYLSVKPQLREVKIKEKSAKDLLLETIKDITNVFEEMIKSLNEQKLNTLSTKNEYMSQLKKQW